MRINIAAPQFGISSKRMPKACGKKTVFYTAKQANREASIRGWKESTAYACDTCGKFHLTKGNVVPIKE